MIASIDTETTGLKPGYHEVVSIAIVPLDEKFNPTGKPFHTFTRPLFPDRMSAKALSMQGVTMAEVLSYPTREEAFEKFKTWYSENVEDYIEPLGHNYGFDRSMLCWWFPESMDTYISHRARDSQNLAKAINDLTGSNDSCALGACAERLGIPLSKAHDALSDALASAAVYKKYLEMLCVLS